MGPGRNNVQNPFRKLKEKLDKEHNQASHVPNNQNMGQLANTLQQHQLEQHGPTVGPMGEEDNDEDPAIYFLNCFDSYETYIEKFKKILGDKSLTTPMDIASNLDPVRAQFNTLDNKMNNHIMMDKFFQTADEQTMSAVTERIFLTKQQIEDAVKDIDKLYDAPFELPNIRVKYGVCLTLSDINNEQGLMGSKPDYLLDELNPNQQN